MDRLRTAIRTRHYSRRTEEAYTGWVRRFILHRDKRHPQEMGSAEVVEFLMHLLDGYAESGCHWGPLAWKSPHGGEAGPTEGHLHAPRAHGQNVAECTARGVRGSARR
jgi:hypothetical protein